ncbi:hypothetical protein HK101_008845 [Irineochytrium annulatum]|nr:hypothetical protein HK101_008845 [Irineochytrium annulatum]
MFGQDPMAGMNEAGDEDPMVAGGQYGYAQSPGVPASAGSPPGGSRSHFDVASLVSGYDADPPLLAASGNVHEPGMAYPGMAMGDAQGAMGASALAGSGEQMEGEGQGADDEGDPDMGDDDDDEPVRRSRRRVDQDPDGDGEEDDGEAIQGEDEEEDEEEDAQIPGDSSMDVDEQGKVAVKDEDPSANDGVAPSGVKIMDLDHGVPSVTKVSPPQRVDIIIPTHSSWFTFTDIHEIEKKALPEFFNNKNKSKTPQVYKDYRDFIVNTYRLNPTEYLTVTACRRNLAGDVCAIIRVHSFLETWGLINYQVDPDSRPAPIGPPYTGTYRVTVDTPTRIQPLAPNIPVPARDAQIQAHDMVPVPPLPTLPGGLVAAPSIYSLKRENEAEGADDEKDGEENVGKRRKSRLNCVTCGVDCTALHYKTSLSTETASGAAPTDVTRVCRDCYMANRFPSSLYAGDFTRHDDRETVSLQAKRSRHDWSDQETLLLLEGLEMYSSDWDKIAEHVATRGKEDCILRFLEIPIEDPLTVRGPFGIAENEEGVRTEKDAASGEIAEGDGTNGVVGRLGGPLRKILRRDVLDALTFTSGVVPFSAADNPVLSVVAMLASTVKPQVAKASAMAAIGQTVVLDEARRKGDTVAPPMNGLAIEKGSSEARAGSMEVDGSSAEPQRISEGGEVAVREETGRALSGDAKELKDVVVKAVAAYDTSATPAVATPGTDLAKTPHTPATPGHPLSQLEKIAATALGAAAARAYAISSSEEVECRRLVDICLQLQLKKLALKMKHFEEIEAIVDVERAELERERARLAQERAAFRKEKAAFYASRGAIGSLSGGSLTTGAVAGAGATVGAGQIAGATAPPAVVGAMIGEVLGEKKPEDRVLPVTVVQLTSEEMAGLGAGLETGVTFSLN